MVKNWIQNFLLRVKIFYFIFDSEPELAALFSTRESLPVLLSRNGELFHRSEFPRGMARRATIMPVRCGD